MRCWDAQRFCSDKICSKKADFSDKMMRFLKKKIKKSGYTFNAFKAYL